MSPEQKAEYIEVREYEAAERRNIQHDKLRAQKMACKYHGYIWVVQGRGFSGRDRRLMEKDPYWFPKHASQLDFACISQDDFRNIMRRAGY
jgi:hypothetical protein